MSKKICRVVGVILHPLSIEGFSRNFQSFYYPWSIFISPFLLKMSKYSIKNLFRRLPPHEFMRFKVDVEVNKSLEVIGIMCPLFPEQMIAEKSLACNMVMNSVKLARKKGAEIVTLAGFTSIVSEGGLSFLGKVDVAFTSGNTLTALMCIKGVEKAMELCGRRMEDIVVAVVGATGDIGSICARILSKKVKKVILCSRSINERSEIVAQLNHLGQAAIGVQKVAKDAVRDADAIILATSALGDILEAEDFKSGAIVCDASMPPNVARDINRRRSDIVAFEGGRASLSFFHKIKNKKWRTLFSDNLVYGCLVESITLALENRIENFSVGKGNISESDMEEMASMAMRQGVFLPDFYCSGVAIPEKKFSLLGVSK